MSLIRILNLSALAVVVPCTLQASNPKETQTVSQVYIEPDEAAMAAFAELPADQPIDMLNMIRFKDKAEYPADSEFADKGWSGERAYQEYVDRISHIADRVGSSFSYYGQPELTMIGPATEDWDAIFVVRYPNVPAFLALVTDEEYLQHAAHRRAAVADSRLVRLSLASVPSREE